MSTRKYKTISSIDPNEPIYLDDNIEKVIELEAMPEKKKKKKEKNEKSEKSEDKVPSPTKPSKTKTLSELKKDFFLKRDEIINELSFVYIIIILIGVLFYFVFMMGAIWMLRRVYETQNYGIEVVLIIWIILYVVGIIGHIIGYVALRNLDKNLNVGFFLVLVIYLGFDGMSIVAVCYIYAYLAIPLLAIPIFLKFYLMNQSVHFQRLLKDPMIFMLKAKIRNAERQKKN